MLIQGIDKAFVWVYAPKGFGAPGLRDLGA